MRVCNKEPRGVRIPLKRWIFIVWIFSRDLDVSWKWQFRDDVTRGEERVSFVNFPQIWSFLQFYYDDKFVNCDDVLCDECRTLHLFNRISFISLSRQTSFWCRVESAQEGNSEKLKPANSFKILVCIFLPISTLEAQAI